MVRRLAVFSGFVNLQEYAPEQQLVFIHTYFMHNMYDILYYFHSSQGNDNQGRLPFLTLGVPDYC